ncbi:MAG: GNAT family N-acetyltransferase [Dermatophilaceae bacterium]
MGRQVLALTVDRLSLIVDPCNTCTFWERTPAQSTRSPADGSDTKRGWLTSVLLEWGAPGRVVLVDGVAAGYVTYAPAHLVPRAMAFPTSPISEDAIVLVTARIAAEYAGQGLGRVLVQAVAKDAVRRGVRAIEAFATATTASPALGPRDVADGREVQQGAPGANGTDDVPGVQQRRTRPGTSEEALSPRPQDHCLLPVDFLTAVGFSTVREHRAYPRLRLDLRSALDWREEVEAAVERLFSPVRSLGRRRPVGTVNREGTRHEPGLIADRATGQPHRCGAATPVDVSWRLAQPRYSSSSRSNRRLGLAPTMVLTTSPPT